MALQKRIKDRFLITSINFYIIQQVNYERQDFLKRPPQESMPPIELDRNLILRPRTAENSLEARLRHSYLSRLHLGQAVEVTKTWVDWWQAKFRFDGSTFVDGSNQGYL